MTINWYGQAFFRINIPKDKNSGINLVIDPFDASVGLKPPSVEADIALITHDHYDHSNLKTVKGNPFVINSPGEYEIQEVFVQGIPSFHDNSEGKERGDNIIYVIEAEDIRVCHLGDLGQEELSSEQLEKIGIIDVLLIPVGGIYTINGKEAAHIVSQIEPKIVIPMHYAIPKLKVKIETADKFLQTMGVKKTEEQPKLVLKKKDLQENGAEVVVLKP